MVFSSLIFLYAFLPANLILYFICKNNTYRNIVLVCFSLFFYAWGEPVFIMLLVLSVYLNYMLGKCIEGSRSERKRRLTLVVAVVLNLGLLGFFKYYNFIAENLGIMFKTNLPHSPFGLPIGISFYTFQILSYVIDVYRGQVPAQKRFYKLLLYVSMYHQLIAGPIVRYQDIADQIDKRVITAEGMSSGINRFVIGLGKKVLLANMAGSISQAFLDSGLSQLSVLGAWYGILNYTLQIYFDFSGYSDMAIGLGRIFGFTYKENFDYPYTSSSVTDFWRRWHMSLSSFFRDYVYIPLGGNRHHHLLNIIVVWGLTGLWHGASWNFMIWGLYYGILLITEKKLLSHALAKTPSVIRHIYLMLIVVIGWVFFYFTSLNHALGFLKVMWGFGGNPLTNLKFETDLMNNALFFAAAVLCCTPSISRLWKKICGKVPPIEILQTIFNILIIILSTAILVGDTYNPFLYFRF